MKIIIACQNLNSVDNSSLSNYRLNHLNMPIYTVNADKRITLSKKRYTIAIAEMGYNVCERDRSPDASPKMAYYVNCGLLCPIVSLSQRFWAILRYPREWKFMGNSWEIFSKVECSDIYNDGFDMKSIQNNFVIMKFFRFSVQQYLIYCIFTDALKLISYLDDSVGRLFF